MDSRAGCGLETTEIQGRGQLRAGTGFTGRRDGDGGDGGNGTSFNSETRRNGGRGVGRSSGAVQPMPPRVRGERSTDTPRTQAAMIAWTACVLGVSVDRPARPMAGPASARNARRASPPCLRVSVLKLVPFPPSPPSPVSDTAFIANPPGSPPRATQLTNARGRTARWGRCRTTACRRRSRSGPSRSRPRFSGPAPGSPRRST